MSSAFYKRCKRGSLLNLPYGEVNKQRIKSHQAPPLYPVRPARLLLISRFTSACTLSESPLLWWNETFFKMNKYRPPASWKDGGYSGAKSGRMSPIREQTAASHTTTSLINVQKWAGYNLAVNYAWARYKWCRGQVWAHASVRGGSKQDCVWVFFFFKQTR